MLTKPTLVDTGLPGWLQPYKQDTSYLHTESTLEKALLLIESGQSVRRICRENPDMPAPQFLYKWFRRTPELLQRYMEAKRIGAELMADAGEDIAAGINEQGEEIIEDVQRSRLRLDHLKWYTARLDPDRFGDKKQIDVSGTINLQAAIENGLKRVTERPVIDITPDGYGE